MPQFLNIPIGGITTLLYLAVNDIGTLGGPFGGGSVHFIFGKALLERFYCVFDFGNKRVGFANTPSTFANLNVNTRFVVENNETLIVV
jgi:cathepsin E